MNVVDKIVNVDPRLWHVYAGTLIHMLLPDSIVCYFPQGHAEHTHSNVDFDAIPRVSPYILCKVIDVKFLADLNVDEVYAKINLSPLGNSMDSYNVNAEKNLVDTHTVPDQPPHFVKILTQSDANGNSLQVPLYGAERIFPKLDCSAYNPAQTVTVKDIHGEIRVFKHAYQGNPRRHVLGTGWNTFVNQKKLVAGDSVMFVRAENGDLCVGFRRARRGRIGGANSHGGRGKVSPEDVIKAESLAVKGEPFEVTYYPHARTPEFVVRESSVKTALCTQWCGGLKFKMAFETKDLSRISWFTGTVSSVQPADPVLWPKSPWRILQVNWDVEQDLLQNVKSVSPWQVEVVSNNRRIQGSRLSKFQIPLLNQNPTHKLELDLFPNHHESHPPKNHHGCGIKDLTIDSCSHDVKKNTDKPNFRLFGQTIHIDQQVNRSSDENANEIDAVQNHDKDSSDHCKVFLGYEDVCLGTLDLSAIESYEKVRKTLANMLKNEKLDDSTSFMYRDSAGDEKQMGDESFSEFVSKAKRLTILKARNG